ncbi:MAG: mandelate racemase/muconate lactonizing enzyme family protein [Eubacteriales bacterium]|nr:mandelate racemase/muconate lactonizing enzyme family protein [Eubacteriales bacterium]
MRDVKITDIDVTLCETRVKGNFADSTRNVETIGFAVVEVSTDVGVTGIGVTYHEVGGEAIREFILYAIKPKLIGRSPFETEAIYEENFHYMRGVGRKGLAFCAYSAVDIALWDIKGKVLDMPLYRLLGGNNPEVPIYASGGWTSYTTEELVAEARLMVSQGYKKIKLKVGVDGGKNPDEDVRRVAAVREAIGPDIGFMLDANNVWRAATAIQFANRVREYNIEFFEEPVFADDIPGLAEFKRGTDIPLATGEHEYTRYGIRDLILGNAVDIIQCDVTRVGGYTECLRAIALSQAWNKAFAPHGMEHMHMHLAAVAPNALYLERLFMFEEVVRNVYQDAPEPVNGILTIPDKPGLGLELNKDYMKEYGRK